MAFDPVTAIASVVDKVLSAVLPDKAQKDAASAALTTMISQGEIAAIAGQLEVDKTEAASNSVFVAGWRPFIGWICGAALLSDFITRPMFTWVAALSGHAVAYPPLDLSELLPLLMGMLGLAAARSYDKTQGTTSGH